MSTLVIAEHDNATLKAATLNTVAAAQAIGGDIEVLIAGAGCAGAGEAASKIAGVSKVLVADNDAYGHNLAENVAALIAEIGTNYSHILATATPNGKNYMPRAAACGRARTCAAHRRLGRWKTSLAARFCVCRVSGARLVRR